MRNATLRFLSLSTLALAACTPAGDGGDATSSAASSTSSVAAVEASSSLPRETANVSYRGVIQPSGISIYMEGTHRLVLDDGRFVLLTSESVDLNDYVNQEVELRGAIRPTVEGNGMIMRVESATVIASSSVSSSEAVSSESSSSSEDSSSTTSSSVAASTVSSTATSKSVSSVAVSSKATSSVVSSSAASSVAAVSAASQAASGGSAYEARVSAMAKDDLTPAKWTQRYCSSHIGFCFDVHKNWWYKSFGTTNNALWSVEISSEEINMPGEGPITVKLLSGELTGATDGQVTANGGMAIGYRAWTEGRHFEITAPVSLQGAVTVITNNLKAN